MSGCKCPRRFPHLIKDLVHAFILSSRNPTVKLTGQPNVLWFQVKLSQQGCDDSSGTHRKTWWTFEAVGWDRHWPSSWQSHKVRTLWNLIKSTSRYSRGGVRLYVHARAIV